MSGSQLLQPFLLDADGIRQVGSTVGDGSYATVVPLSFRGLKCAGKKLHAILYDNASPQEKERMIERFQEECQLLSRVKHPNVVQFLGIHFEEGSDLPVLVMEFLHCTLSECLERYGVLRARERVSLGILDDVATGLCYLHGHRPPIVHRDLSANNVLLSSDMGAKISDLGVAKILNMTPARMSQLTKCPGTPPYMPPEALEENPEYNTQLDCFSMGVMILHVLCGSWPIPSKPNRVDPDNPKRLIALSEIDRREKYFQQIRGDHPLVNLVHGCLDNHPPQRPDADRILGRLRRVISQSPPSPENKMELLNQMETLEGHKDELSGQVEQLQRELSESQDREEKLELTHSIETEELQCTVRELCTEVEGLRKALKSSKKVVEAKEIEKQRTIEIIEGEKKQAIQALKNTILTMESQMSLEIESKDSQIALGESLLIEKDSTIERLKVKLKKLQHQLHFLHWKKVADMPMAPSRPQSVLIHHKVFVASRKLNSHDVLCYDHKSDQWSVLPPCPEFYFGLGQLSGKLIAVGGCKSISIFGVTGATGNLYTFNEDTRRWEKSSQPMPTPRALPIIVSYQSSIAVCGGYGGEMAVEVFDSETSQWHTAAPLPVAHGDFMHVTIFKGTCYIGGGVENRNIMCAPLSSLFQSRSTTACDQQSSAQQQSVWNMLPDLPYKHAALTNTGEDLLALGGFLNDISYSNIYVYHPSTKSWVMNNIANLPQVCSASTAVSLPSGEIMLIGGGNFGLSGRGYTRDVYIGK